MDTLRVAEARSHKMLEQVARLSHGLEVADGGFVVMGSVGRREATSGSDLDYSLVVPERPADMESWANLQRAIDTLGARLVQNDLKLPSGDGVFGSPIALAEICERIGRDADTDTNLTQRMLLLLEAVPVRTGGWAAGRARVLRTYLDQAAVKDHQPPRFFLNDVIRYWRTMCVDYEGKMRERRHRGWATRNGKLRTVRKMLFAFGLLPLLRCYEYPAADIEAFLTSQYALPPAHRVADAFNHLGKMAAGGHALSAYCGFLNTIDNPETRAELEGLRPEGRRDSPLWQTVKQQGRDFQAGLEVLLFESDLASVVRRYVVF